MANRKFIYPLGVSPDDPASDEFRRAILCFRLSEKRTTDGALVGIFGASVCQCCGQLKEFNGLASAVFMHINHGKDRIFICYDCLQAAQLELDPGYGGSISSSAGAEINRRLLNHPYRYCDVCGAKTPKTDEHRFGTSLWACQACINVIRHDDPDADVAEAVGSMSRIRFYLRRTRKPRELLELERRIEAARQQLEDFNDPKKNGESASG